MQRPPITVSCDCGESREVPYGEAWRCESCGRVWDTNQIPAEEYEGLLRRMKRARLDFVRQNDTIARLIFKAPDLTLEAHKQ